ncbi:MAG: hypothetical protein DRR42_16465, partial [Gammaproteobacteria bacterium]
VGASVVVVVVGASVVVVVVGASVVVVVVGPAYDANGNAALLSRIDSDRILIGMAGFISATPLINNCSDCSIICAKVNLSQHFL